MLDGGVAESSTSSTSTSLNTRVINVHVLNRRNDEAMTLSTTPRQAIAYFQSFRAEREAFARKDRRGGLAYVQ